jgi:hypothetical protein
MSQTVLDAITASIAELAPIVATPSGDLGYGTDLSCVSDATPDLAEVDPQSVRAIGEATIRRLTTPRGGLPDDRDYGLDVRAYVNRGVATSQLRDLQGMISNEITKDDRIDGAAVTLTMPEPKTLNVQVMIDPADPNLRPFPLTFAVGAGGQVIVEAIG